MSFTDEDLKRLKFNLENHAPNWVDKDNLAALISRLEAAEKVAEYFECRPDNKTWWPYVQNSLEIWRKAAGKE